MSPVRESGHVAALHQRPVALVRNGFGDLHSFQVEVGAGPFAAHEDFLRAEARVRASHVAEERGGGFQVDVRLPLSDDDRLGTFQTAPM